MQIHYQHRANQWSEWRRADVVCEVARLAPAPALSFSFGDNTRMSYKVPAIVFLLIGLVFVCFSRQVTALFRWFNKSSWDEKARRRFPQIAPIGDPPRSVVLFLGVCSIGCAIVLWFLSQ